MNFNKSARPVIMGRNGMVSAGHSLGALAGVKVLQEGGNAIDAALAAAFVMAVVKPEACGPGGDLFALVFMKKNGKVEAINSSGPAPAKASIDYFREQGLKSVPTSGPLSVAVPGAVDGWLELHKKYGTKDLSRLTSDAIDLARGGFPLHLELAEAIEELSSEFPWVDRCFRQPIGEPTPGKLIVQKGLGDVLEKISRKGRDGFYAGEVAENICRTLKAEGGVLTEDDLQSNIARWLEPLSASYRDYLVFEQPPVSQGFMVLEMLNIIEAWPLHTGEPSRADSIHYQVGAKKLAFEDRIRHLEDPDVRRSKNPNAYFEGACGKATRVTYRRDAPTPDRCYRIGRGYHLSLCHRSRRQCDFVDPKCLRGFWFPCDRRGYGRYHE